MRSLIVLGVVLSVVVAGLIALALFLGSTGSNSGDSSDSNLEPLTIVTEPRVFERLLSRVAPLARQRLEPRAGWSSAPRAAYKPS